MNRSEVVEITKLLANAYPGAEKWTPERVQIWAEMLRDLDAPTTRAAAIAWIGTQKWAPVIAEIRELATGGGKEPSAGEAWEEVCRQISMIGSWGWPTWSSGAIGEAVNALGGWLAICVSENAIADRAHFLRLYDQIAERWKRVRQAPDGVRWLLERDNEVRELPTRSPLEIANDLIQEELSELTDLDPIERARAKWVLELIQDAKATIKKSSGKANMSSQKMK